jgi:hypothetical protein
MIKKPEPLCGVARRAPESTPSRHRSVLLRGAQTGGDRPSSDSPPVCDMTWVQKISQKKNARQTLFDDPTLNLEGLFEFLGEPLPTRLPANLVNLFVKQITNLFLRNRYAR